VTQAETEDRGQVYTCVTATATDTVTAFVTSSRPKALMRTFSRSIALLACQPVSTYAVSPGAALQI
jgi:hypothetical protein